MGAATIPTDLTEIQTVEAYGMRWRIGLIPAGRFVELRAALSQAYRPIDEAEGDAAKAAARVAQEPALLRAYGGLLRWGVVGWEGARGEIPKTTATYDGETYSVLAPLAVEKLLHVDSGALAVDVGLAVMQANQLTTEDLLGFP